MDTEDSRAPDTTRVITDSHKEVVAVVMAPEAAAVDMAPGAVAMEVAAAVDMAVVTEVNILLLSSNLLN